MKLCILYKVPSGRNNGCIDAFLEIAHEGTYCKWLCLIHCKFDILIATWYTFYDVFSKCRNISDVLIPRPSYCWWLCLSTLSIFTAYNCLQETIISNLFLSYDTRNISSDAYTFNYLRADRSFLDIHNIWENLNGNFNA